MNMKKDIKSMDKENKNPLGTPAIILMGIGAILSAALFYFMFNFADQGNMIMVILTALLIVVVSFGTMKGLAYISKRKF
jgi:amino acid transporter